MQWQDPKESSETRGDDGLNEVNDAGPEAPGSLACPAGAQSECARQILSYRHWLLQAGSSRMEDILEIATISAPTAALADRRARANGKARRMALARAIEARSGVFLEVAAGTLCHPEQDTVSRREARNSSHDRSRPPPKHRR